MVPPPSREFEPLDTRHHAAEVFSYSGHCHSLDESVVVLRLQRNEADVGGVALVAGPGVGKVA
jgi:hypothetical protein